MPVNTLLCVKYNNLYESQGALIGLFQIIHIYLKRFFSPILMKMFPIKTANRRFISLRRL